MPLGGTPLRLRLHLLEASMKAFQLLYSKKVLHVSAKKITV